MADNSAIEWCDATWNPITGCTPVSAGCANCYARRTAETRLRGRCGYPADEPFRVIFHPKRLDKPRQWREPRRIFVCSMGDLFHPNVQSRHRAAVLKVIEECPRHTFMLLTKRPLGLPVKWPWMKVDGSSTGAYPPNVWVGVTVEDEDSLWRVQYLSQIPAAVRFISCEPLLEEIEIGQLRRLGIQYSRRSAIDWLIVGPETGPNRRPCDPEWIRSLIDQADEGGVPVFVKAFPLGNQISRKPAEWPGWAQRREFPVTK